MSEIDLAWQRKLEVTELLHRYFATLDQKQLDTESLSQIFAQDAQIQRPNGAVTLGPQAIGESQRNSFSRFRATQHLTSGELITLKGEERAEFRANLVAMHVWAEGHGDPSAQPNDNYFLAGGVVSGHTIRTEQGWRITWMMLNVVWRRGTGFSEVLRTR